MGCRVAAYAVVFFSVAILSTAADNCQLCQEIAAKFSDGIQRSFNRKFSDDSKRNAYIVSDTRFAEISDSVCKNVTNSKDCYSTYEIMEPYIDKWWSEEFKPNPSAEQNLKDKLCVNSTQFCCPDGQYGEKCTTCSPCNKMFGTCDGDGTRSGSGKCVCGRGYTGDDCSECNLMTHFPIKLGDIRHCAPCLPACIGGCSGIGESYCRECAPGYTRIQSNETSFKCVDIDECTTNPCFFGEYCTNTAGSYECKRCHAACNGCSDSGSGKCTECAAGFKRNEDHMCEDIDECEGGTNCLKEGESCANAYGTFVCICDRGYNRVNGSCVPSDVPEKPITRIEL